MLDVALEGARLGLAEGGIPIGALSLTEPGCCLGEVQPSCPGETTLAAR